ncbi:MULTISPECIES: carbon-nitrogen hydrolase family protein [unclassified Nocardioides]|uniref:carbon-nitrogen hydrolase family protein n=1 Tax=unclassified Nocardioides TaxID=2615069 RepID=UPI0009EFA903|nr:MULTISPECIES: carbon-nitrogen hydrolase family protein [unclassified Nocardioides]GAW51578.1 nitrilase/cyanide hydratase and apolipoprotein N-acyltransferase [Nocardioides sp. PD653-B2]GAW54881.1 nitrilase/cyanide hydratase and apolipoprotein N-acyltransferase [Nocardioides sp. PD653]
MTTLRVAAGQAVAVSGDLVANVRTAARLTALAGSQEVRLLVLPEAFLTGYDIDAFAGALPSSEDLDGPWLDPLRAEAVAGGVTVVVGTALQRGELRTLAQIVVRADGTATAPYDKQHLDGLEKQFFTAGDHGASITVDGVELGLSICYDGCFPEHAAAAARDGAVGYLSSSAYFPGGAHRRDLYYPARALENGMYVVFSGLTGPCGDISFIGGSAVYDPEGRRVAGLVEEEGLAIADLDTDVVAETRATHTMFSDHRADLGPRTRV